MFLALHECTDMSLGGPTLLFRHCRCDDPDARVPLGLKYGANPDEAPRLLAAATACGLRVVGVSFHVGSACRNLATFEAAIATARKVRGQHDQPPTSINDSGAVMHV